jgi:hypothetical protein
VHDFGVAKGCLIPILSPRVQALLAALWVFRLLPNGFTDRDLRTCLAPAGGGCMPGTSDILHLADQPGFGLPDQRGEPSAIPEASPDRSP